jgi:Hypothetical protein (DUF2513)
MKRDMDLARAILLKIEEHPDSDGIGWVSLEIEGRSDREIGYHVMLLHEADLLEAIDASDSEGSDWRPVRLTWAGHEFLDAARQEGRWQKAKEIVKEKTGGLSFEAIKALLIKWMTDAVLGG